MSQGRHDSGRPTCFWHCLAPDRLSKLIPTGPVSMMSNGRSRAVYVSALEQITAVTDCGPRRSAISKLRRESPNEAYVLRQAVLHMVQQYLRDRYPTGPMICNGQQKRC